MGAENKEGGRLMGIDKALLLAAIKAKADRFPLIAAAVLDGLATALQRGDFDEKESDS